MNKNFEKDNPENLQLAKDAHRPEGEGKDHFDVFLVNSLYRRHPDAVDAAGFLLGAETLNKVDEFKSIVHDLERRGILRTDVMGNSTLYTLTRDFYAIMSKL